MDLKQNRITIGELLDYPPARAVLARRFPTAMKHPMLPAARSMTLSALLPLARTAADEGQIRAAREELRRL